MLRQYFAPIEASKDLEEFHEGLVGGHYGTNTTMKKIMSTRPTIHKDVDNLCQRCDICQ